MSLKKIKFLFLVIIIFSFFPVLVFAQNAPEKKTDLFFFYGQNCPHCTQMKSFLEDLKEKYPTLSVIEHEVYFNAESRKLLSELAAAFDTKIGGVPTVFIDSKTSLNSVVPGVAANYDLKFEQNATFLERNKNEEERHIRNKLKLAAKIAERKGKVVVIGHPYKETINVLSEELPKLEKQGFVIVSVTELDDTF